MKSVNYIVVPSTIEEAPVGAQFENGKCVRVDEGHGKETVFLGHYTETITEQRGDKEVENTITRAFAVRVDKPVTRGSIINAAEMEAYDLHSPMDVASLAADLARKSRANADDAEVKEHDEFIAWVKEEMDKIGFTHN